MTPAQLPDRAAVLDLTGPLTVKEVESLVFVAARVQHQFETSQRTWLEADRSYFLRWREAAPESPLRVIGLIHAFQLPEMAARVMVVPFDDEFLPALHEYVAELRNELEREGFQ